MATGGTQDVYKDLKDVTECPICLETYIDPRSLPCTHVLCIKCLQGLVKTAQSENRSRIKCPLCQKEAVIPTPPNQFPVSFLVNSLTDILQKSKTAGNVKCQPCLQDGEESAATWICFHCSNLLCKHCKKYHDRFHRDKNHLCIEFQHLTSEYIATLAVKKTLRYCVKHDKELEYLCENCQELLCVTCKLIESWHKDHKTLYAKDEQVLQEHKQKLETFQKDCTSHIQMYESCIPEVKDNGSVKETEIDGVVQKIESHYEEACAALKKHKDKLVKRANLFRQHHQHAVNQKKTRLGQEVEQLKADLKNTESCCREGTYIDIISGSMDLKNHEPMIASKPSAVMHRFKLQEDFKKILTDITHIFGDLKCTSTCSITSQKVSEFYLSLNHLPSGVCCTTDGKIAVAEWATNNIHIFTKDGKPASNLEQTDRLKKADNVQIHDDQMYVSDTESEQVHIFREHKYHRSINTGSKGDQGITICNNDLYATSGNEDCVYIIPLDNPTDKRIFAKHAEMKCPGYITTDGVNIIISCSGSKKIFVYDLQGNLLLIHRNATTGIDTPEGIITDVYHHIIVADGGNNRLIFLSGGQVCGVIATEGEPCDLAINAHGDIVVTMMDPLKVVTYSYQVKW